MADNIDQAINTYKLFLQEVQAQHERTIREAHIQLENLILQSIKPPEPTDPPRSVWITGNDDEPFLLLNKSAADHITNILENLSVVLAELLQKDKQDEQ